MLAACTGDIGSRSGTDMPELPRIDPEEGAPPEPGEEFTCVPDLGTSPPLVRRLTRDEYLTNVERLTGVNVRAEAAGMLPPDAPSEAGFSNYATGLTVQYEHALAYGQLAALAVQAMADERIDRYAPCREARCFEDFISALALDAFGSAIDEGEQTSFVSLQDRALERGDGFDEAARDAFEVALQAPRFLYRLEEDLGDGSPRELQPLELARRLSFLALGRPADAELRAKAEAGDLNSNAGIERALDELLAQPEARVAGRAYMRDWLDLGALETMQRDPEHFPEWRPEIGAAMLAETLNYFDETVWEQNASLSRLFDGNFTYASEALAEFYGIPAPDENGRVDLGDVPERGGLLTQGGVLALTGGGEASTVARGLAFSALITCGAKIPEPPATVSTDQPPPSPGQSKRDFSEQRVENPECAGCHASFEPPIWGLIRYDAIGRYSETDEAGNYLPEDGFVRFITGEQVNYESPAELGQALAASERVRECVVLNVTSYSLGRALEQGDGCELSSIRDAFLASDQTYRDLLVAIATSRLFQTVGTAEGS
ncbi:MAG: DUF1592 domain-containing protein [Myxococcota bacterium]